jgi:hypothetical protein
MVHDRPYKTALTHTEALAELRNNAGTQFDPVVVNVFCAVYAEGVPPDGLEEVYLLHQRASGGLDRIDPRAAAALLYGTENRDRVKPRTNRAGTRTRATSGPASSRARPRRIRAAEPVEHDATDEGHEHPHPHSAREATG